MVFRTDLHWLVFSLLTTSRCMQAQSQSSQELQTSSGDCCDCHSTETENMSEEKRLIRHLLARYDKVGRNGRPVMNMSDTIHVHFGLGLVQMDLNEKNKLLQMSTWCRYKWQDAYLQWQPSEYGGVERLGLAPSLIWIPDVMLYNTADSDDDTRDVLVTIQYDGTVVWVPHKIFRSSCSLDVSNFPFDEQTCNMWFGSWTYTRQEVDVHMAFRGGIDLSTFQSDYKESSEWTIKSTAAEKRIMPSVNQTPNYAVLIIELNMKRKLVFSSYILTLPCVFLASLTLVVFWLPPDRPDRTSLAMSVFASFLVLLLILLEAAPPTASSVPILGVYYCFNMVIIMLSVFLSSLVVNICRVGDSRNAVPLWLRKVVLDGIARMLFMRRQNIYRRSTRVPLGVAPPPPTTTVTTSCSSSSFFSHGKLNNVNNNNRDREAPPSECSSRAFQETSLHHPRFESQFLYQCGTSSSSRGGESESALEGYIGEMQRSLHEIRTNLSEKAVGETRRCDLEWDWRQVALVLDRLFFISYILLIALSLVFLFPRPK